jgi:DNA-binding SARP family transcriptional activator
VLARRLSPGPFVTPPRAPPEPPPRPDGVEVRVLGSIEILGTAEPVDHRPRLTELLVYLAFHRDSIVRESFGTALWPERRIPGQTISNRLSEARRALGASADGRNRLRRVHGRLHLADEVVTDWDRFGELTSEGSGPQSWRLALSLVRGRPFQGLAQAEWTVLEGYAAAVERAIVETALALGEYYLSASNPSAADWAAQQGLLASPWDERLYRILMRSAEAAGNRGAIDAALRSLAQVLELRGDPLLGVHPTTAQLYRSLMHSGGSEPPPGRLPR